MSGASASSSRAATWTRTRSRASSTRRWLEEGRRLLGRLGRIERRVGDGVVRDVLLEGHRHRLSAAFEVEAVREHEAVHPLVVLQTALDLDQLALRVLGLE